MNILVLFAALAISHYATGIDRLRSGEMVIDWFEAMRARWSSPSWLDLAWVLGVSVLVGGLVSVIAYLIGGQFLWALVALIVLLFCLGPRDLDRDVDQALAQGDHQVLGIAASDDAHAAGMRVYVAALSRWFGVIVWFVLLGIPGALLYRITERLCERSVDVKENEWLFRLRFFLEWPVLVFMMVSSAMTNDFDRVYQAWHRYRQQRADQGQGAWMIHRQLLETLSDAIVPEGLDQRGGVQLTHHFVWRLLILWLVILSVLLLTGWLS
ncbi:MAG TPA: hypothetical protein VIC53_06470 [Wenzhouxiangella sp.]